MTDKQTLIFGETLRRLREEAGFDTGKQFAEHIGWIASKVSRVENGRTLPSDADVRAWLDAVNGTDETRARTLDSLRELRLIRANWKRQLRGGHADRQRAEVDLVRNSTRIVMVDFHLVPGLLQTAEYAAEVFRMAAQLHDSEPDTDAAVRERIRRQDVLYDSTKRVELLVAETALIYPLCSPAVLLGQLNRIIGLTGLPNVAIGIIPAGARLPVITMHGYAMFDDFALVEVNHTELEVTDPGDLELYERITAQLWQVALRGEPARELLTRLAGQLQPA